MKTCITCRIEQPERSFWRTRNGSIVRDTCAACERLETARRYYYRHREMAKAAGRVYRSDPAVRERRREQAKVYRQARRAILRERLRQWRAQNIELARRQNVASMRVRRMRKAGVDVEQFQRESIFTRDKGLCAYCGLGLDPLNWHLDHVVPISNGGGHLRRNVVAACATCNMKKGAREAVA